MSGGNDSFTTVLLHFDGTNGSTTITDDNAGGSAHTWAASSSSLSTSQAKFGPSSLSLPGSAWINTAISTDWAFGTSDFTIDFWQQRNETGTAQHNIAGQGNSGLTGGYMYFKIIPTTSAINFSLSDAFTASAGTITDTSWHHIAAVRTGNSLILALDGTFGSSVDVTGQSFTCAGGFSVGRLGDFAASTASGFVDEFRISKGIARWTSNFTPPTVPYDTGFTPFSPWQQRGPLLAS